MSCSYSVSIYQLTHESDTRKPDKFWEVHEQSFAIDTQRIIWYDTKPCSDILRKKFLKFELENQEHGSQMTR